MELVPGFRRDDVWTSPFALRGVVPYGTESGVTTIYRSVILEPCTFLGIFQLLFSISLSRFLKIK
jgi:hypothetical protein